MCDRVIVLEQGKLAFDGDVRAGIRYFKYEEAKDAAEELEVDEEEIGNDI